jgi:hypothetical protein
MPRLTLALVVSASLALAACATDRMRSKTTVLDQTLREYAAAVRWRDMTAALDFIDPKLLAEHPPADVAVDRLRQVHISSYDEQPVVPVSEDEVRQVVRIELLNVNTQQVRSFVDRQTWKWDEEAKRWWLVSGLPDISRN